MKNYICRLLRAGVLLYGITLYAMDETFDELDAFADTLEWSLRAPADVTPQDVLDFVAAPPILLQQRLQSDLYLFTSPANQRRRSLLDYPFNILHDWCLPDCGFQGNLWGFVNITNEDNYTDSGTNITSYWNLADENIIRDIDQIDFGINIPNVLSIFGLMRMQEARAGFMAGLFFSKNRLNVEIKAPFYYYERNFFLTPEEKERLDQSLLFDEDNSGTTSNDEENKHVVSDAFGLGDTRVCLGCFLIDQENFGLNVGLLMTLPTAFAFDRGLIGGNFQKNSLHQPFDLLSIFQLGLGTPPDTQAVTEISMKFLASAFDKLSANLLQPTMGNGGHVGTGAFFENYLPLNDRFKITTRGAAEYLFPSDERRFYITKKFPQEFIAREPYTTEEGADPAQAPEKLAFLNQQLIDTFIPRVYNTSIYPGFIIRLASELSGYFGKNWSFGVGYDLWWQDRERLGSIRADPLEIANIRTDIATRPGAFQNKVFATVHYEGSGRWLDSWCLTFYGDYTFLRTGIGKDYTLALRFSTNL